MQRINSKAKSVGIIFSVFICFSLCFYASAQAAGAENIEIYPYVQNVREESDGTCSAVVMWKTYTPNSSKVEYRVFGSSDPWRAAIDNNPAYIREIKLSGLEKGKKYTYRVYDGYQYTTPERSFYAPIDYRQPFSFAFYSDPHEEDGLHCIAAEQIRALGAHLVLTGGDYGDNSKDDIDHFLKDVQHYYLKEAALYPVLGNHDLTTTGTSGDLPYFSLPYKDERHYSFDYGNCHFIALCSNHSLSIQTEWLRQELIKFRSDNGNLKKWLIVFMHVPAYTNGAEDDLIRTTRTLWAPLFRDYEVDLVFSGHVHTYDYLERDGVNYLISGVKQGLNFLFMDVKNDVNAYNNLLGSNLNVTLYRIGDPVPKRTLKFYKDGISLKISTPKSNDFVRGQLQITGRAMAAEGFQKYELYYARAENPANRTLITSSNVPINNGILGVWDTTSCQNGRYVLTLKGTSNIKTAEISVRVNIGDPFYRFFNANSGDHFYTANEAEKDRVLTQYASAYTYEGIACGVSLAQRPGSVAFYRLYNRINGAHFYTANAAEKDFVLTNWGNVFQYEGIACYVYPVSAPISGSVPLYRFWNQIKCCHFYTASEAEKNYVINTYSSTFVYEGIACFVYPAN